MVYITRLFQPCSTPMLSKYHTHHYQVPTVAGQLADMPTCRSRVVNSSKVKSSRRRVESRTCHCQICWRPPATAFYVNSIGPVCVWPRSPGFRGQCDAHGVETHEGLRLSVVGVCELSRRRVDHEPTAIATSNIHSAHVPRTRPQSRRH